MESRVKQANELKEEYQKKFEQVKRDIINLKKTNDKEKQVTIAKQAEEIENLKNLMRTKQIQDDEKREL